MGDAARRKKERERLAQEAKAKVAGICAKVDLSAAAKAVRQVVSALTDYGTADCLLYVHVASELLDELGLSVSTCAGFAAWRVGPGEGDVISYWPHSSTKGAYAPDGAGEKALMFHAWLDVDGLIVDFSTWTLNEQAKMLDEADGGHTDVQWAPDFVVTPPPPKELDIDLVAQAPWPGVFAYRRDEQIERRVFADEVDRVQMREMVLHVYRGVKSGHQMRVIGVGFDGHLQEAVEGEVSNSRKLVPFEKG